MSCSLKTISQKKTPLNPVVIWTLRVYAPEYTPAYAPEPMAECMARLEETASQTLRVQITATSPYRYRFEGMVHTLLHIKTIECSIKNPENAQRAHSPRLKGGNIASELQ
jgi:hypothetical protein